MARTSLWMSGTIFSFCLMAVAARELSGSVSVFEILFFRSFSGLIMMLAILSSTGNLALLRTQRPGTHLNRNIFHFAGQYGWVFGIGVLPLAEVFALEFTVPIWTAIIAAAFLGERFTLGKTAAISLGMLGVIIIVKPGSDILESDALIVLAAAVCYAVAHTTTKSLTRTEAPLTVVFYMSLLQMPIGLCLSIPNWVTPGGIEWLWLLSIGITALTGHYCMTKAIASAEVGIVMTLDFLRLPAIAVVGMLLYAEQFDYALLIGGLLMLIGNLINFRKSNESR